MQHANFVTEINLDYQQQQQQQQQKIYFNFFKL